MVGQPEHPTYDPTVYEYEVTDPVQGGVNGIANLPLLNLANRTAYLKQRLDQVTSGTLIPPTVAPLNGPAFTGSTTAPNVRPGDDSTLIANTDFVQTRHHGIAVVPVGGNQNVTLTQDQWGCGILIFTGVLTANIAVLFPPAAGRWIVSNRTTGAFTLTFKTPAGTGVAVLQAATRGIWCDGVNILASDRIFTGTGEVQSADLAPTGAPAGTYNQPTMTIDAGGRVTSISSLVNLSVPGNANVAGGATIGAGGIVSTGGISSGGQISANGNITAGGASGRFRAAIGALGGSDLNVATILNDFPSSLGTSGWQELPNGFMLQWGQGATVTGQDFVNFPRAFPVTGLQVFACEGNPQGWLAGGPSQYFSTTFGTQQIGQSNFALYCMRSVPNAPPILGAGVSYRYYAIGH